MSYQVETRHFNGPLDLLLQLIERSQIEVTAIALSEITSQYLGYLSSLNDLEPEELNWFVELAAKLMFLKSQALLPDLVTSESTAELEDLSRQLAEYGRFKLASRHLSERLGQNLRSWERTTTLTLAPDKLPLPVIEWQTLENAFRTALARIPIQNQPAVVKRHSISLGEMIERLKLAISHQSQLKLSTLLDGLQDRHEIVVMFLSLLELIKSGLIIATQTAQFNDMTLINSASQ